MSSSNFWIYLFTYVCISVTFSNSIQTHETINVKNSTPIVVNKKYEPSWESLDSRPLPAWFDEAKFGIFIHWGVFSVPSFHSEWFCQHWKEAGDKSIEEFMKKNYKPGFSYQDFAKDFTTEFFNATQWSEMFEASGAKYIVLTSKHHEGYALWPSKYSYSWNSLDVGPHRDLIGELSAAVKNTSLKFGLYHSLYEWFNPLHLADSKKNFTTDFFVRNKVLPEMKELVVNYEPQIFWSDGDSGPTEEYWKSKEFLAWLYNDSPVKETVVTNDRWGSGTNCKHGDFYNCQDRYNPGVLQKHKWENAMTIDKKSWGYRRNAVLFDYYSLPELVKELVITVSTGGNLLMNVGPTKDGMIPPIFEERLREMGKWLKVNGEAIYKSKPWVLQNDTLTKDVWYTAGQNGEVYAILLSWPNDMTLHLSNKVKTSDTTEISFLHDKTSVIKWKHSADNVEINLPPQAHKGEPAWVLKMTNLLNSKE